MTVTHTSRALVVVGAAVFATAAVTACTGSETDGPAPRAGRVELQVDVRGADQERAVRACVEAAGARFQALGSAITVASAPSATADENRALTRCLEDTGGAVLDKTGLPGASP